MRQGNSDTRQVRPGAPRGWGREGDGLGEGTLAVFLGEVAERADGVGCHSQVCKAMEVGVCDRYVGVFGG